MKYAGFADATGQASGNENNAERNDRKSHVLPPVIGERSPGWCGRQRGGRCVNRCASQTPRRNVTHRREPEGGSDRVKSEPCPPMTQRGGQGVDRPYGMNGIKP